MRLFILMAALSVAACAPENANEKLNNTKEDNTEQGDTTAIDENSAPPKLVQSWIADGFSAPEGVAYGDGKIFISNVAGQGTDKDGEGWISVLSTDGEIINNKLVTGLDAPKGMAIRENNLFVADIDRVHIIDHRTGDLLKTLPVADAKFLNDVTNFQNEIYVSDSATGKIHVVQDNQVDVLLEDDRFAGINGLTGLPDRLMIATMEAGSLFSYDSEKNLVELASGMTSADGIGYLPETGGYLVSSWPGQIWYVSSAGQKTELLNTADDNIYQNDLTVLNGNLVIVPNWQPGTVTAWEIE